MKPTRLVSAIVKLFPIPALVLFAGCGKKEQMEKYVQRASPTPTPTPHVYKLWEPRPITLNADKPLIVPAATAIPTRTPKR